MEQNNNIVIIFSKKAETALFDIEKKYNLDESEQEWIKKIKIGQPSNIKILVDLIRKLSGKEISEKDFVNSLRKDLKMSEQTALNVLTDTNKDILSFLRKIPYENIKAGILPNDINEEEADSNKLSATLQPSKNFIPPVEIQKTVSSSKSPVNIVESNVPKKRVKKTTAIEENKPKPVPQPSGPDAYREPIE